MKPVAEGTAQGNGREVAKMHELLAILILASALAATFGTAYCCA